MAHNNCVVAHYSFSGQPQEITTSITCSTKSANANVIAFHMCSKYYNTTHWFSPSQNKNLKVTMVCVCIFFILNTPFV